MKVFLLKFILIASFFPVFFDRSGLFKGSTYDVEGFALPASLFTSLFSIFFLNKRVFKDNYLIILLITYCLLIFLFGIFISGSINPSLLLIYIVPMFSGLLTGCFFAEIYYFDKEKALDIISLPFFSISFFALLHIISSVLTLGISGSFINRGEDQILGLFSIYQKLVYYPTLLSISFFLGLALLKSRKAPIVQVSLMRLGLLIIALDVFMVGSRESMVLLLAASLAWMWASPYKTFLIPFLLVVLLLFVYSPMAISFINSNDSFVFISKWLSILESGEYTAGRSHAAQEVFSSSAASFNIFFGTFFSLSLGDIRTPHNQYLEILLRGGIIGGGIFLMHVFLSAYKSIYFIFNKIENDYFRYYSFAVMMSIFLISFNVNTPLRSPLVSSIILFYVAFLSSKHFINIEKN